MGILDSVVTNHPPYFFALVRVALVVLGTSTVASSSFTVGVFVPAPARFVLVTFTAAGFPEAGSSDPLSSRLSGVFSLLTASSAPLPADVAFRADARVRVAVGAAGAGSLLGAGGFAAAGRLAAARVAALGSGTTSESSSFEAFSTGLLRVTRLPLADVPGAGTSRTSLPRGVARVARRVGAGAATGVVAAWSSSVVLTRPRRGAVFGPTGSASLGCSTGVLTVLFVVV